MSILDLLLTREGTLQLALSLFLRHSNLTNIIQLNHFGFPVYIDVYLRSIEVFCIYCQHSSEEINVLIPLKVTLSVPSSLLNPLSTHF